MTNCPRCATPREGARFCPRCGFDYWADAALTACPRCHTARSGTLPICPNCGYDYRSAATAAPQVGSQQAFVPLSGYPQAAASATTGRSSNLTRGALLLGLVVVVVAVGGFLMTRRTGVQPNANQPPAGTIWFGTSVNTSTFAVSGQASSFVRGIQVVVAATFSTTVSSGKGVNILIDGVILRSTSATSDWDLFGMALNVAVLPTGAHTFQIEDLGGNMLASGTVTITP